MFTAFTAPFGIGGNRADALLMIEHRPPPVTGAPPPTTASAPAKTIPPIAIPAPGASLGAPTGSANSITRGRY
jgi:hypothetical protein